MDKLRDIGTMFPQAWQANGDDIQPEIEVFAKRARLIRRFQVAVRCRDHADVYWNFVVASDRPHFSFLQYAQEFGLHLQGKLADFVEEDGSAIRGIKKPCFRLQRSRKCALFVAEELAFHQRGHKRSAVHGNKRHLSERTAEMNGARDEFLACSAFSGDQTGVRLSFSRETIRSTS